MYSLTWTEPAIFHTRSSILYFPSSILNPRPLSLQNSRPSRHLVAKLFGDLFRYVVVGHFIKSYFSVGALAGSLQRLHDLIDALVSRHAVAADRFPINNVRIFSDVPI